MLHSIEGYTEYPISSKPTGGSCKQTIPLKSLLYRKFHPIPRREHAFWPILLVVLFGRVAGKKHGESQKGDNAAFFFLFHFSTDLKQKQTTLSVIWCAMGYCGVI